jgi:hypothetical protein
MAYYIFLKSLRSLEEFRKNPHVKIPPKSPCANFHSPGKFKNPIFNSEILFPCFQPGRPCAHSAFDQPAPAGLSSPAGRSPQASPSRSAARAVGLNAEVRFLLGFTPFVLDAFSLSTR